MATNRESDTTKPSATTQLVTEGGNVRVEKLPEAVAIGTGGLLNQEPFAPRGYVDCLASRCSCGTPFRIEIGVIQDLVHEELTLAS